LIHQERRDGGQTESGNATIQGVGRGRAKTSDQPELTPIGTVSITRQELASADPSTQLDYKAKQGIVVVRDPNPRRRIALMAATFAGLQPATIAAVTGTNGKSSTVHFDRHIWAALGLDAASVGAAYVVLCPVAVGLHRGQVKAWDGFGRLCDDLRAQGHAVVACPAPGERAAVAAVLNGAAILPSTDVGTFAALLAASQLVIANDSGPGHVAAAVGARLVSVFGVTEPTRTRPWGPAVTLVGSERGWPRYEEVTAAVAAALSSV